MMSLAAEGFSEVLAARRQDLCSEDELAHQLFTNQIPDAADMRALQHVE